MIVEESAESWRNFWKLVLLCTQPRHATKESWVGLAEFWEDTERWRVWKMCHECRKRWECMGRLRWFVHGHSSKLQLFPNSICWNNVIIISLFPGSTWRNSSSNSVLDLFAFISLLLVILQTHPYLYCL